MSHVLLVEPDDDFCLFLQMAISTAGCRMTITGSIAEARATLHGNDTVDLVVTSAVLPDGSGLVLARDAVQMSKPIFVLRKSRGRIEVSDRQGIVFRGDQLAVGDYLEKAIQRRWGWRAAGAKVTVGGGDVARSAKSCACTTQRR